ncbi:MAG: hypothetical protein H6816_08160 [Phycisphaerales bacterium]|nr:hypothetical protein [Phycisphaerales bacterium]
MKVYAPLDGRILKVEAANGSPVAIGDVLCTLAPGEKDLREALRAFALVGTAEDLDAIRAALNRTYATKGAAEQGEITIKLIQKQALTSATACEQLELRRERADKIRSPARTPQRADLKPAGEAPDYSRIG